MAILYNPNDETNKISNLRKAVYHLAEKGSKNQLIIGDYNTNLNKDLDYVNYSKNPHQASREFLHGLKEDSVFINVFRFLYSLIYWWPKFDGFWTGLKKVGHRGPNLNLNTL